MTKPHRPWSCARCRRNDAPRDTPRSKLCAHCAGYLRARGEWWCAVCSLPKPHLEFATAYQCAACRKKRSQDWRAEHADEQKRKRQDYYAAHADEFKRHRDDYYATNRDALLARKQTYYEGRREEIKEKVRTQRERRRPESIQREQTRRKQSRAVYKANTKIAARIALVEPIAVVEAIRCPARPEVVPEPLRWEEDLTHLISDRPALAGAGRLLAPGGRLYLLAHRRMDAQATDLEARRGGSYYMLLASSAEPRYLALWRGATATAAPEAAALERRAVPRKVLNHAQALLRELAAQGSPLAPPSLRSALGRKKGRRQQS